MANQYHMEARIKQDRLDRWKEQKRRAELGQKTVEENPEDITYKQKMEKVLTTDPGQFNQVRPPPLPMFRVNQEGYCNRYQNRQHLNPHVDKVFVTLYPESDNSDYNMDDNRVHRRLNSAVDRYQVSEKVNGKFQMQLLKDSHTVEQSVHSWTGTERNRRFYDYSCNGPILGSTWRELRRELNFREKCLSGAMLTGVGRGVPRHAFVPADRAFTKK